MLKMAEVDSKEAAIVKAKAIELLLDWSTASHTITPDNGNEFAQHKTIASSFKLDPISQSQIIVEKEILMKF